MRYGESILEDILRRTDLVRLVSHRVKLNRRGRLFWGLCPFHKEKSPSFKVESERRNYKCFGCGVSGDAFKWLMETEGLKFPEAVERLAQEAGVTLPKRSEEDDARESRRKSLYEIVESACLFFERQLLDPQGAVAREYLLQRGLDQSIWKRFRLGYAPQGRNALSEHLKKGGIAAPDVLAAGLARENANDPPRDFFFHRVMFPIADAKGRVVAFGARAIESENKPKYINTGETALFSKGQILYNFHAARTAAFKSGQLLVAEGYMDVIALVRAGLEASVAPLGTALTADHLASLWRVAPEPIVSFDGDEAGRRAAARAALMALPLLNPGHSLRFAFLPIGEDPDSLLRSSGPDAIRTVLDDAIPLVDMVWRVTVEGGLFDTPERKAALVSRINERLREISSSDVRRFYVEAMAAKLSAELGVKVFVYGEQIRASAAPAKGGRGHAAAPQVSAISSAIKSSGFAGPKRLSAGQPSAQAAAAVRRHKEREVLALLLDTPEIVERHYEALAALPISDRSLDSLRQELLNLAASGFSLETERLEDHLVRAGMANLLGRLKTRRASVPDASSGHSRKAENGGTVNGDDVEARWLQAAAQLREMAEFAAERKKALERFISEASEESWRDWHRLLLSRAAPGG
jgi:DNA primase